MKLKYLLFTCVIFIISNVYAQTQTSYIPTRVSPKDLGINSRATESIIYQIGSATSFRTYYGTESCTGNGTAGLVKILTGLPYIEYLYSAGSSTINFSGFTHVAVGGSDILSASAVTGKIDAVAGTGTTNVFTDTTLAGQGTITASFGANGLVISPAEYSCADGGTSPFQTQIDTKLTRVGTPTTYLNSVTADGKTGTTSFSLEGGSNITFTSILSPDGSLAITGDTSGSATAKPDIKEGGTVTATNTSHIDFDTTDFDTAVDGLGALVALSAARKGTTTATAGYTVLGDANGSITAWLPSGSLVGHSYGSYTAYTTWTASSAYIPFDNTIPQSSEGVEILTVTHTPKAIGNIITVHVSAPFGANDNDSHAIAALFLDSESNARMVGVNATGNGAAGFLNTTINFIYKMTATGTSPITFKLRGGSSVSSGNVFLVNGVVNAQYFGGIYSTSLEIFEFKP